MINARTAKSTVTDAWETPAIQVLGTTTISTLESNSRKWDEIIFSSLVEWGRDPRRFDDELIAPTPVALNVACQTAIKWRDSNVPPPACVVPSGDGGVYFRWGIVGETLFTAEFTADGNASVTVTKNCEVVSQEAV